MQLEKLPKLVATFVRLVEVLEPLDVHHRISKDVFKAFVQYVARVFVQEIRTRASAQSTETASVTIENFLIFPKQNGAALLQVGSAYVIHIVTYHSPITRSSSPLISFISFISYG